jgi:hypothetical protein
MSVVARFCNPTYSGGRDKEDGISRLVLSKNRRAYKNYN